MCCLQITYYNCTLDKKLRHFWMLDALIAYNVKNKIQKVDIFIFFPEILSDISYRNYSTLWILELKDVTKRAEFNFRKFTYISRLNLKLIHVEYATHMNEWSCSVVHVTRFPIIHNPYNTLNRIDNNDNNSNNYKWEITIALNLIKMEHAA